MNDHIAMVRASDWESTIAAAGAGLRRDEQLRYLFPALTPSDSERIYLANEPTVPVKVPAVVADPLASALSGQEDGRA